EQPLACHVNGYHRISAKPLARQVRRGKGGEHALYSLVVIAIGRFPGPAQRGTERRAAADGVAVRPDMAEDDISVARLQPGGALARRQVLHASRPPRCPLSCG